MPTISRFFGIVITINFDEHAPPHFHATYGDDYAGIGIRDFTVLNGHLHPRALALVVKWAALHQAELLVDWELASAGRTPIPIAPLG
jgi:hypothetical protein